MSTASPSCEAAGSSFRPGRICGRAWAAGRDGARWKPAFPFRPRLEDSATGAGRLAVAAYPLPLDLGVRVSRVLGGGRPLRWTHRLVVARLRGSAKCRWGNTQPRAANQAGEIDRCLRPTSATDANATRSADPGAILILGAVDGDEQFRDDHPPLYRAEHDVLLPRVV